MRDLLSQLFLKRRDNEKLYLEQRVEALESQVERLRGIIGSLLIRIDGSARKASFAMIVQDVFNITGRGTIVTGKIEKGVVRLGDRLLLDSPTWSEPTNILAVEKFQLSVSQASSGENVGLLLSGISVEQALASVLLRSDDTLTST